jgi:hypothetical protein
VAKLISLWKDVFIFSMISPLMSNLNASILNAFTSLSEGTRYGLQHETLKRKGTCVTYYIVRSGDLTSRSQVRTPAIVCSRTPHLEQQSSSSWILVRHLMPH